MTVGNFLEKIKKQLASYIWLDICAGGICIRERRGKKELLCIMHKKGGLMLPKGRIKYGESHESAAKREFEEETGLYGYKLGEKIGILRDRYRRKKIVFFWFHNPSSKHSEIHDEAIVWTPIEKALPHMKHASERKFIEKYILEK